MLKREWSLTTSKRRCSSFCFGWRHCVWPCLCDETQLQRSQKGKQGLSVRLGQAFVRGSNSEGFTRVHLDGFLQIGRPAIMQEGSTHTDAPERRCANLF